MYGSYSYPTYNPPPPRGGGGGGVSLKHCNHKQNMKVATKRVTNVHQVHVNSVTFHKLDNAS